MWPNPQFPADLVTFTEETLMENFISCAVSDIDMKHVFVTILSLNLDNNFSYTVFIFLAW